MESGIRDIHYMGIRLNQQRVQFQIDTSETNYKEWSLYESWLVGRGRKTPTVLKQLGAFKRLLKLYPSENIKNLTKEELIELNSKIVNSKYVNHTKIGMQIFLRSYLRLFANDERKKEIESSINVLAQQYEDNPDSDEMGKVISKSDFKKICKNMPNPEFSMMVKVLYSTGMRITELYNIMPSKVEYVSWKLFGIKLPAKIFGYKGAWIYTRGKRTKSKTEGRYLYYMSLYVNDFKQYLDNFESNEYVCNYSYSYFLQSLHKSVELARLDYRVHPHMFRHTVATRLFKLHSDAVVKKIMNWSKNSNMPAYYSHINKQDIIDAMNK